MAKKAKSNTKKTVKKKKGLTLTHYVLIITTILVLVLGVVVYRFLFPSYTQDDLYGRRDDNLYQVTETDKGVLEDFFSAPEFVQSVSIDIKGAIIYILVDVSEVTYEQLIESYPLTFADTELKSNVINSYDINATFLNEGEVVEEGEKAYFPVALYHSVKTKAIKWQAKHEWEYVDPNAAETSEENTDENSEENSDSE